MRFDMYHPFINLIFFVSVIYYTLSFTHPVYVALSFVVSSLYLVWLKRKKGIVFILHMIIVGAIYTGIYIYYNHYGVTVLSYNIIDNAITKEVALFGIIQGIKLATFFVWFAIINEIFTTDKTVYLIGRIWPKGALFISIFLRNIPRIRERIKTVSKGRYGIGKGFNIIKIIWIVITYTIENIMDISASMKSRGMTLKKRKAYSIYRFENKDRTIIVFFVFAIMTIKTAIALGQTYAMYNPQIIIGKMTVGSYLFYIIFAAYLSIPMILEMQGDIIIKAKEKRRV